MRGDTDALPHWFAAAYCGLMAVGFCYGAWGLPWYVRHLVQLVLAGAGALFVFGHSARARFAPVGELCRSLGAPFVWMLAYSLLCWAFDLRPLHYVTRGVSTLLYCLLALAAMGAAVCLFRARAIDLTFYSMCLANLGVAAYAIKCFGPAQFLHDLARFAASGGTVTLPAAKMLELHDLTFAFGLMALYYLLFDERRGKGRALRASLALFFFALGWKRIGVLALAAAALLALLVRRLRGETLPRAAALLAVAAFAGGSAYIYTIHAGAFVVLAESLGINLGGRGQLWEAFQNDYKFTPLFRGYGVGYVTRTISLLTQRGVGVFGTHGFGGLHNDILTMYIELGFAGWVLWLWDCWYGRTVRVFRSFGSRAAQLLLCETAYVFVTYTTDNTAFYCYVNTVFMLLPLASACGQTVKNPVPAGKDKTEKLFQSK